MTRALVLRNTQSPGDLVMLTSAVRDLHAAHPGAFYTNVISSCPDLWEHNPNIRPVGDEGELIHCSYDPREWVGKGLHFIHGFRIDLERQLGVAIPPGECKGDIHLSHEELTMPAQVEGRFWIINAGVKNDFTCKQWDKYQAVVDHFRGKLRFVQVGASEHLHPVLDGVIDLLGKTTMRELIRLVHHADGALTGVSCLMHLCAAVPMRGFTGLKPENPSRPCVVVAGAREPPSWEAYPNHKFISNVGSLPCCASRACWRSRTVPLGDGLEHDLKLCAAPVEVRDGTWVPKCMDLISAAEVASAVESFLVYG